MPISGAKNAVLKLMSAAVMCEEPCTIANAPRIADVEYILEVLRDLGAEADWTGEHELRIHAQRLNWDFIPLEAAQRLRASFVLLGPMLGRRRRVIIPNPGGDRIGRRPVNVHTDALGALGAQIVYKWGYYYASAPSGLHGTELQLGRGQRDGHRERVDGRRPGRRANDDPQRRRRARGRQSDRLSQRHGRSRTTRSRATDTPSRSKAFLAAHCMAHESK